MTVNEAAAKLGITPRRVRAMIAEGGIRAQRHGRDWWIPTVAGVKVYRKAGRPKGTGARR